MSFSVTEEKTTIVIQEGKGKVVVSPSSDIIRLSNVGVQGVKGDKGDTGDVGATGAQGIQGVKGDKGDTGDIGATGAQGPQNLFVQDAAPIYNEPFLWVQTNYGGAGGLTIWVEDGV